MAEAKITKEEIAVHPPKNTTEVMCFLKCLLFQNGEIDAEGKINVEEIEKDVSKVPNLTDKQKEDFTKCVLSADKIEKCEDVQKIYPCWSAHEKIFNADGFKSVA